MAQIQNPRWIQNTIFVTENREGSRTATPPGVASELVGYDGSVEGRVRPFHGFLHYTDLEFGHGVAQDIGGEIEPGDVFNVSFRVGVQRFGYGFIYRVLDETKTKAVFRLKFRVQDEATWRFDKDFGFDLGLIGVEDYDGEQMDVCMFGRFIYVGRTGKEPFMFYVESTGPSSCTLNVVTDLGPGKQPEMVAVLPNSVGFRSQDVILGLPIVHPDMGEVITELAIPTDREVGASARVIYCAFTDGQLVSQDNINFETNALLAVVERNPTGSGGLNSFALRGPSDLKFDDAATFILATSFWVVPPFPDPSFDDGELLDNTGTVIPPTFSFPTPNGEYTNVRYRVDLRDDENDEPVALNSRITRVWQYQLRDSRTGRVSQLSNRLANDSVGGGVAHLQEFDGGSGTFVVDQVVSFGLFYVVYDTVKWDTLLLYRGTKGFNDSVDSVIMSLESVLTLADFLVAKQPVDTDWKRAGYMVQLGTDELAQQVTLTTPTTFLEDMPPFGACAFADNMFLAGNFGELDPDVGGLGLLRWASLFEVNPELFEPADKHSLRTPTEEVQRFIPAGPNNFVLTKSGIYMVRRESLRVKIFQPHKGWGIDWARGATEVGSEVYLVTSTGLKVLASSGALSSVTALNEVFMERWDVQADRVSITFDSEQKIIFVHNQTKEHTLVLWLETSRVTELFDGPFLNGFEGVMPALPTLGASDDNPLQERALFVYPVDLPLTENDDKVSDGSGSAGSASSGSGSGASGSGSGGEGQASRRWRVVATDFNRVSPGVRLLPYKGSVARFALTEAYAGGTLLVLPFVPDVDDLIEGCYLYVLDGVDAGMKLKVLRRGSHRPDCVVLEDGGPSLPVGTRLGVSPIYARFVGHQVGLIAQTGEPFAGLDVFRNRTISGVRTSFSDVSGDAAGSKDAKWRGLVFVANEEEPRGRAFPQHPNGEILTSVTDGASEVPAFFESAGGITHPVLFPGIEVFCPDLEYGLLGVLPEGTIEQSDQPAPVPIRRRTP